MQGFAEYLAENEELIKHIESQIDGMDQDDKEAFADYIVDMFFDDEEYDENDFVEDFELEDVNKEWIMGFVRMLDQDELESLIDDLDFVDDIEETISRKVVNKNKKRRKFMKKTATQLRKEKIARKAYNRKNKQKRKAYYKKNKNKIKAYQKDYAAKTKKGMHIKKVRKKA